MGDMTSPRTDRARNDPPERIHLHLMGVFRVRRADGPPVMLPRAAGRLVAYLGVHGPTGRGELAGALWLDSTQSRANADLRTALWRLRKATGPLLIHVTRSVVALSDAVVVDLHAVEGWALEAIAAAPTAGTPDGPPPGAGRSLLPGWDEEWLSAPRERLRLLQVQANESIGYRLLTAGHAAEALPYALRVVQSDPLRESGNQLMVEIHLRQGNLIEASRHYERYRRLLHDELAIEPGIGITSLINRSAPLLPPHRAPRTRQPRPPARRTWQDAAYEPP